MEMPRSRFDPSCANTCTGFGRYATQWMGQVAFLTRRLENARGEFSITALAYNIPRAISLVGVPSLIASAKA